MDGIGEGHGGDAVHHRLQRGTQGAGVGDVVARVVAVIDAGENVIGLFLQDVLQRYLDAVHRRAVHLVGGLHGDGEIFHPFHPQGGMDGKLLGHGAALMGRGHHPNITQLHGGLCQQRQTGRMNGIIIDNKNLHRSYSLLYIILQDYSNGFEFPQA